MNEPFYPAASVVPEFLKPDDITFAQNAEDLRYHERQHRDRQAFTFTTMNLDESECLGCIYINPLREFVDQASRNDQDMSVLSEIGAHVSFWVRTSRHPDGLDGRVLRALINWFVAAWEYASIAFGTYSKVQHQVRLFEDAGLLLAVAVDMNGKDGQELMYVVP